MKKFLILTFLLTVLTLPVRAEQPAAEKYRQMFASGNFFVEYEVADSSSVLVYSGIFGGTKKHRHEIRAGQNGERIAKVGSVNDKYPLALYQNGKYYKFILDTGLAPNSMAGGIKTSKFKRYAIVIEEGNLNSPNLDPDEGWQNVRADLSLPEIFIVLFPNDPMNDAAQNFTRPIFNGSSKRTIDDKEFNCDQYISEIKSLSGAVIALEAYNILYDGDKLARLQKYLVRDDKELLVSDLIIHELSAQGKCL